METNVRVAEGSAVGSKPLAEPGEVGKPNRRAKKRVGLHVTQHTPTPPEGVGCWLQPQNYRVDYTWVHVGSRWVHVGYIGIF
jgi:hypothetical protein